MRVGSAEKMGSEAGGERGAGVKMFDGGAGDETGRGERVSAGQGSGVKPGQHRRRVGV